MKKTFKVLATATLAFSMFASVAMADTTTTTPTETTSATTTAAVKTSKDFTDLAGLDAATALKVDALLAKGYMEGKTDTTFDITGNMTRAEAAKLVSKVLGLTVGTETTSSFSDVDGTDASIAWSIPFIEAAKKAGIIDGMTDTTFAPKDNVTIGQLATMFVKGLGKVADVKETTPWYQGYMDVAKANGVDLGTDGSVAATRADLVTGSYAADVAVTAAKAVKITEVSATTAKTLKVTFNKAVDTTKAAFEVKKDGTKINTSAITFNEAKTEATVELTSKVTKAEYTVNVSGLGDTVLTGTVTAADEKVAKIEVLSTEAPLVNLDGDLTANDVNVGYKVTNQYGEDITKTTSVITSNGTADPSKGVVSFMDGYDTTTNKTIAFTIINVDSNVSVSAVVTVVATAVESDVTIVGVYNKDGKTLAETTDLSKDQFFLEVVVKDQYGKVIATPDASKLLVSETNTTIVNLDDTAQTPNLDTTTVDGKVLIAIAAPGTGLKAGSSDITLISKNTGKSTTATVKVAEGVRTNTVTIGQPALVAAGEDALLPLTVLDKSGNAITDLDVLNSSTRGISVGANTLVKTDGIVYLKVTTPVEGPNIALVTVLPTQQIVTANYTVRAAAKPAVITGVDSAVQKAISVGLTQSIKIQDLVIEDQYGRVMTDANVNAWMDVAGNSLVVNSTYDAVTDKSPFTVTAGAGDAAKQVITASTDVITLTAKSAADLNSTEKLTFVLSADGGTTVLAATSKDLTFSKVGITEFASFEVAAPTAVFNDNASTYAFKVYGVKADGSKTLLKSDQYNLIAPVEFTVNGDNNNTLGLTAALANTVIDNDSTTTNVPLTKDYAFKVVINNDEATTVNKTVTVSAEPRKAVSFKTTSDGTSAGTALTALEYTTAVLDLATLEQNLYYVDQYGKETIASPSNVVLTFSNLVDADTTTAAAIADNGTAAATVSNLEAGDTVKVKIEVDGLDAQTFTVTIK